MKNGVMLITYPDSLGRNLSDLEQVVSKYFSKAVTGIHVLPFFPSSGDRGFAPMTYRQIDSSLGDWSDMKKLAENYDLMFDYMINHISTSSEYFQDFVDKGDDSQYKNLFIDFDKFWGSTPTEEQIGRIYKRKPLAPIRSITFFDGTKRNIWFTFGDDQVDLNLETEEGLRFLDDNLRFLAEHGAAMIRLDAFAYTTKVKDTDCFFVEPKVWEILKRCADVLRAYDVGLLPEIHEHFSIQEKLARNGYPVYDFALPMLVLHALYFHEASYLSNWYEICPRNQFTTLDTHDGIGVVDVRGLLPDEEIEATKEHLFTYGANVKRIYNTAKYNNLDIYQINCTYYSALGEDDKAYLLARALQFFSPGTPQVYYVGMLAGRNDIQLLEETKEGRNINRHYYTLEEIEAEVQRPVVQKLLALMELRSTHPAFKGEFSQQLNDKQHLILSWKTESESIELHADFQSYEFEIVEHI